MPGAAGRETGAVVGPGSLRGDRLTCRLLFGRLMNRTVSDPMLVVHSRARAYHCGAGPAVRASRAGVRQNRGRMRMPRKLNLRTMGGLAAALAMAGRRGRLRRRGWISPGRNACRKSEPIAPRIGTHPGIPSSRRNRRASRLIPSSAITSGAMNIRRSRQWPVRTPERRPSRFRTAFRHRRWFGHFSPSPP
jgi:hypothetical protein